VSLVRKFAHNVEPQSTYRSALDRLIEVGRRADERVECLAVVAEFNRQMAVLQLKRHFGHTLRLSLIRISVPQQIGKKLFDYNEYSRLIICRELLLECECGYEVLQLVHRVTMDANG
jgi:hypothetical protein